MMSFFIDYELVGGHDVIHVQSSSVFKPGDW